MKKVIFSLFGFIVLLTGCNQNSYSNLLKEEKKLIKNFISRNHYVITSSLPDTTLTAWDSTLFYEVPGYDNIYFHLTKQGPKTRVNEKGETIACEPLAPTENVIIRYRKFTLTENPDTFSYWSTLDSAYPMEFNYLTDYTNACVGWHIACGLMGYSNSECVLICPSKLGFVNDQNSVTPYGYQLRMQIKR